MLRIEESCFRRQKKRKNALRSICSLSDSTPICLENGFGSPSKVCPSRLSHFKGTVHCGHRRKSELSGAKG